MSDLAIQGLHPVQRSAAVQPSHAAGTQAHKAAGVAGSRDKFQGGTPEPDSTSEKNPVPDILQSLGANGAQQQRQSHTNIVDPQQSAAAIAPAAHVIATPVAAMNPSFSSGQGQSDSSAGGGGSPGGRRSPLQFQGGLGLSGGLGGVAVQAYQPH